jgi:hypothetical protein
MNIYASNCCGKMCSSDGPDRRGAMALPKTGQEKTATDAKLQ